MNYIIVEKTFLVRLTQFKLFIRKASRPWRAGCESPRFRRSVQGSGCGCLEKKFHLIISRICGFSSGNWGWGKTLLPFCRTECGIKACCGLWSLPAQLVVTEKSSVSQFKLCQLRQSVPRVETSHWSRSIQILRSDWLRSSLLRQSPYIEAFLAFRCVFTS